MRRDGLLLIVLALILLPACETVPAEVPQWETYEIVLLHSE